MFLNVIFFFQIPETIIHYRGVFSKNKGANFRFRKEKQKPDIRYRFMNHTNISYRIRRLGNFQFC